MRSKLAILTCLLSGCAKHITVEPPLRPIVAADRSYAYYTNAPGDWTVISKTGPEKAVKDICPHGVICTVEPIGTMYRVRRAN